MPISLVKIKLGIGGKSNSLSSDVPLIKVLASSTVEYLVSLFCVS